MKARLTDALLQKRKTPETGRDEIFDLQVPGFGIRIGQRERSFFFIRRVNGEKARFSLGTYPAITLSKARADALDILDKIKRGENPREDTRRKKEAAANEADNSFAKIAQRFINEYAMGKKKPLRARTVKGYEWALTGEPAIKWQGRALASITDRDIIEVIDGYEAKKQFASARLLRAYLHRFFRWAVEKRLIDKNPASGVPLASIPSDFKRERFLSIDELRAVIAASDKLNEVYRAYVHALVLTGQRERETALMKWGDLTLDSPSPLWFIPGANAKNHRDHVVPLAPQIADILRSMPRIGDFVFTTSGKGPISGFSKIKVRMDEQLIDRGMDHWTWHDLRRSAATGMANIGFAPHVIEEILNHVSGAKAGVAGLYNRSTYDEEHRRALTAWAQQVASGTASDNVVKIVAAKAR